MRLALLAPLPPEQTGIADHAAHCRRALNQAGVEVLTPLQGQRPPGSLSAARAWVAERDWRRVDVVHAELGEGRLAEFYTLCALAERPDRPALSATVHDPDRLVWQPSSGLGRWADTQPWLPRPLRSLLTGLSAPMGLLAERRLARHLEGVAVHTQQGGQALARRLKLRADRLSVIPHGVQPWPVRPLPQEPLRVLYFGFVHKGKGIEDLIDAMARLRARHADDVGSIRLCIAGGSAPEVRRSHGREYLQALRARIERRGLATQVDWELDVDERDLPDLIQRHHLVVLPHRRSWSPWARHTGTSGALAWALACGRGVIASDARAFPEEIALGLGACYPQGDVGALTATLLRAATEAGLMQQWADKAAAVGVQRAWGINGQRFAGHMQRAVERGQPGRATA